MKLEPYKAQPVLYISLGGAEYAAIVTDVRDGICDLAIFSPGSSQITAVTRIKYFDSHASAADHKGPACCPAI